MLLIDTAMGARYDWDGTDGEGSMLNEPCTVTTVTIDREAGNVVIIRDEDGIYWGVRAKTLSPMQG